MGAKGEEVLVGLGLLIENITRVTCGMLSVKYHFHTSRRRSTSPSNETLSSSKLPLTSELHFSTSGFPLSSFSSLNIRDEIVSLSPVTPRDPRTHPKGPKTSRYPQTRGKTSRYPHTPTPSDNRHPVTPNPHP